MLFRFFALFLLLLLPSNAISSRILVSVAADSKSHLRSALPLINRLGSAGHEVHVFCITSEPVKEAFDPNVTLLKVPVESKIESAVQNMGTHIWRQTMHTPMMFAVYYMISQNFVELVNNQPEKLAAVLNSEWDLVIAGSFFSLHAYAFAQILHQQRKVPYAMFGTSMVLNSDAYSITMGRSWLIHPHPFSNTPAHATDGFDPKCVMHRLVNVLENAAELTTNIITDHFVIAPRLALLTGRRHFSFAELYAQSEMTLVDSIELLAFPQPSVREVLNSGAHCEESAPLPEDYRAFVEDPSSKGTVYVAFGTFIPWDYAPPHVAEAFFNAFERLPDYRFVFSYRGKFPNRTLSAHIRLVSWAPQLDLLAHPKTRVFLTHCGLKSIKESLCTRTPMFAMPMFAEQAHNAKMVLKFGTGIALSKFSVDEEKVYAGIRELLDNPTYARRVHTLQRIFVDRPMDALDEAEFYLSRVARGGPARLGRNFHKRKGVDLWLLQSAHLDAVLALFAIALLLSK